MQPDARLENFRGVLPVPPRLPAGIYIYIHTSLYIYICI